MRILLSFTLPTMALISDPQPRRHLNGYDDYKRSCHDGCLHVPLVICGGPFKGGKEVTELVSTESIPKTLLALAGVDVGDKMIGEKSA